MSSAASPLVTPEEYLELERDAETKSEYHDGEIVAMPGANAPQSLLAVHLGSELHERLKGSPGLVFDSNMKVWVRSQRHFFYPDLSGLCGQPQYHDEMRDALVNPSFVVEVLSPKTEAYDRGKKLARYMALPSLIEIALVSQEDLWVDKYTRQPDGIWRFDVLTGGDAVMRFESLDCNVPLRDFYEGVELAPPTPPPPWSAARIREDDPLSGR